MKVNIYETIEIDDDQRVKLANVLDGEIAKPKRIATRDEIKAFAWDLGSSWAEELDSRWSDLFENKEPDQEPEDEDIVEPDQEPDAEDDGSDLL